mmetsp:Transcript_18577/g.17896  ORF Transcript_18577/g.17896 Transcript_18577/m.17896 type:complete len:200 (+) Transcript_18577:238-837(+)
MGNKISSPFPTYESACSSLNPMEILHLKETFNIISKNGSSINLLNFTQNCKVAVPSSQFVRKYVLPRIFTTVDLKKDNLIDFEEYVCAVALFRVGTTDDKIRVLFLMYEPFKGTHLLRENLKKLLVDSTIAIQREAVPASTLETWINDQADLSDCMTDMALQQFASTEAKLDLREFIAFVKVEGSLQGLLLLLPCIFDS